MFGSERLFSCSISVFNYIMFPRVLICYFYYFLINNRNKLFAIDRKKRYKALLLVFSERYFTLYFIIYLWDRLYVNFIKRWSWLWSSLFFNLIFKIIYLRTMFQNQNYIVSTVSQRLTISVIKLTVIREDPFF